MSSVGSINGHINLELPGRATSDRAPKAAAEIKATPAYHAKAPLQASYRYDQVLHQVVITLHNLETGVIREIPAEQVRNMATALLQTSIRAFDNAA